MPTPYINIVSGYQKHCSIKCGANDIATKIAYKETCQKHYGVSNVSQAQEVKNKKVQTCYKNYNVNNPYQIPSVKEHCIEASKDHKTQEKRAQTNLERYGNICSVQNIQIQQKIQEKMLNQYGGKILCLDRAIQKSI